MKKIALNPTTPLYFCSFVMMLQKPKPLDDQAQQVLRVMMIQTTIKQEAKHSNHTMASVDDSTCSHLIISTLFCLRPCQAVVRVGQWTGFFAFCQIWSPWTVIFKRHQNQLWDCFGLDLASSLLAQTSQDLIFCWYRVFFSRTRILLTERSHDSVCDEIKTSVECKWCYTFVEIK